MGAQIPSAKIIVDGKKLDSISGKKMKTVNPFTNETLAEIPECDQQDVQVAVEAAKSARQKLSNMTVFERSQMLYNIADKIEENKEELAKTLSMEVGKVYHTEALGEVTAAIQGFRNVAEQVKWIEGSTIQMEDPKKRTFNFYQPKGTYAVITPFNFPVNIATEYIAPGLAAGNTIVLLPSPTTSYTTIRFVEIIHEASIPSGVVNVITGPGHIIGDELVSHPDINGIGFTGSTPTGKKIAERAAGKAQIMELGGNGPTIVLEDANIEKVAESIFYGCFVCAGQTCSAAERILVHESIQEELAQKLVERVKKIRLGDPLDQKTTMGPLHAEHIAKKMDRHVEDAIHKGAKLIYGGKRVPGFNTKLLYEPTILINCSRDSLVNLEETFGPIAPMIPFKTHEEALEISMDGNFGLLASVYTNNPKYAFYFGEKLRTGIVNINDHSNYWEVHVPFGGASGTKSGNSRIGGLQMIKQMSDLKTIVWDLS
mgnify:CR=1 FL=1